MTNAKKILIYIGCAIIIFSAGFCTGRFCRLRGTEQLGSGIVSGVEQQGDLIDQIGDDNTIIRDGLNTIGQRDDRILAELGECKDRIGQLESSLDEFAGIVDSCDENFRRFETEQELYYGTMEYLLGIAKAKAESDARINEAARELYKQYRESTSQ